MSNTQEACDNDSDWYRAKCISESIAFNDDAEEAFLERVCVKCADGIDENKARNDAFNGV